MIKKVETFKRRLFEIIYFEEFNKVNFAIEFEKRIKGWSRKNKECLIYDKFENLKELSVYQNKTNYNNKSFVAFVMPKKCSG